MGYGSSGRERYLGDVVEVKTYADVARDPILVHNEPQIVVDELNGNSYGNWLVAWLPRWLIEDKFLETVGQSNHIISVMVKTETEKAFLGTDSDEWLPKSQLRQYRKVYDAPITRPQSALDEFSDSNGNGDGAGVTK